MSVVYRSWEVASGPTMGYNMSIQGNVCATADTLIPEASNYSSNTLLSPESFMKAVTTGSDVSKGLTFPNHKTLTPQDTVIRGFSSLSLHPQLQLQASSPSEDCKTSALLSHSGSSDRQGSPSRSTFRVATRNLLPLHDNFGDFDSYVFPSAYHRPRCTLDVVAEDKPFEENSTVAVKDILDFDALSTSSTDSVPSLHDVPDGSVSSGEGLYGVGESEVQSVYKGSSTFNGGSPRKGLSRFYAGKSRSFSCLGDVMSLRDLAKPENPYAKKRRCQVGRIVNAGRPQLPPLQKGAASISKKAMHNGKSTLALAVAMSTREVAVDVEDDQSFLGAQRSLQRSPLTSRSYSLSDLQRATQSQVSAS